MSPSKEILLGNGLLASNGFISLFPIQQLTLTAYILWLLGYLVLALFADDPAGIVPDSFLQICLTIRTEKTVRVIVLV